jgi:hypothetical protein
MNRIKPLVTAGSVLAVVAVWAVLGVSLGKVERTVSTAEDPPATPAAGYVVHIDPATGQLASTPGRETQTMFDEEMRNRLSTSSQGLVETPSPVPGGGTMVDLQGRFQNAFVATVDDSGQVHATCVSSPVSSDVERGDGR